MATQGETQEQSSWDEQFFEMEAVLTVYQLQILLNCATGDLIAWLPHTLKNRPSCTQGLNLIESCQEYALQGMGLITQNEESWELTEKGKAAVQFYAEELRQALPDE